MKAHSVFVATPGGMLSESVGPGISWPALVSSEKGGAIGEKLTVLFSHKGSPLPDLLRATVELLADSYGGAIIRYRSRSYGSRPSFILSVQWKGVLRVNGEEVGYLEVSSRGYRNPGRGSLSDEVNALAVHISLLIEHWELREEMRLYKAQFNVLMHERTATLKAENRILQESLNQKKQLIRALALSEQRYRSIIESSGYGEVSISTDGHIRMANSKAARFLGFRCPAQVCGLNILSFVKRNRDFKRLIRTLASSGKVNRRRIRIRTTQGYSRTVEISGYQCKTAGKSTRQVDLIIFDVTRATVRENNLRRSLQRMSHRNRGLYAFSHSVSHDLKAPLRTISNYSGILLNGYGHSLDEEGRKFLRMISSGSLEMSAYIEKLHRLFLCRDQALEPALLDMDQLVSETIRNLSLQSESGPVRLVRKELPAASGDPVLVRHIFQNLLENALKFSREHDTTRIEIGGWREAERNVYYVRDNGVGFRYRDRKTMFRLFQRLHGRNRFKGHGIGLALVRRIVVRHGGRIWARGIPGSGATFYFSLPLAVSSGCEQGQKEETFS